MNYTEQQYNSLLIKEYVDKIINDIGIDITKWNFSESVEGKDYFSVYFYNNKTENHTLFADFLWDKSIGDWRLEKCEINQD